MTMQDAVSGTVLFHAYLIDIEIAGTTYYMTDLSQTFTYQSNDYIPMGDLLGVGTISHTLNPGDQTLTIVVSGLGGSRDFKQLALSSRSKGGAVTVRRALSEVSLIDLRNANNIYDVYKGFIQNIDFAEEFAMGSLDVKDSVIFSCSNRWSLRKDTNKGRKTEPQSFNAQRRIQNKAHDPVMDRVAALNGKKFAFGRTG